MNLNKVQLIGRVGSQPEVKSFDNGGSITNFSLATNERYTNKNGEKIVNTDWHNIQASGPVVGIIEKYVNKGDEIYIEGKLKTRSWESNGQKHYLTYVDVKEIQLGSKKDQARQGGTTYTGYEQNTNKNVNNSNVPPPNEDDLPF